MLRMIRQHIRHVIPSFALILGVIICYELQEQVQFPTLIRLLENALCQQHYATSHATKVTFVPESECKIPIIQHRLATVRGWYSFWNTLPVLFLGPTFATLADMYGRRMMLSTALFGMVCNIAWTYFVCALWATLSTKMVWLSFISRFIGGGPFLVIAFYVTIVAELSDDDKRSVRLYQAFAVKLTIDLFGPQLASVMLEHSLELPYGCCAVLLLICILLVWLLPETMPQSVSSPQALSKRRLFGFRFKQYTTLIRNHAILLSLLVDFLVQFRYNELQLLPPYISVRYGWKLSQVAKLLSIIPAISLVIYVILPPLTSNLSTRSILPPYVTNMYVLRSSCAALGIGTLVVGLSGSFGSTISGLCVYSTGFNVRAAILASTLEYIDKKQETAMVYSLITTIDALGHLIGSPVFEIIWGQVQGRSEAWLRLPFLVLAPCFIVSALVAMYLPPTLREKHKVHESDHEEDPLINDTSNGFGEQTDQ